VSLIKFEKLREIGFKLFEDILSNGNSWEIKGDLFYRIKRVHGIDYLKNYFSRLLDEGNLETIKLLFYSEIGYEITIEEEISLYECSKGNIIKLFAKAIKENESLAESYLYFFYENESDINRNLREQYHRYGSYG
jgi:hypothetical protein